MVGRVVYYHLSNLTTVENLILAWGYDLHLLAIVPFKFLSWAGNSFFCEEAAEKKRLNVGETGILCTTSIPLDWVFAVFLATY